VLVCCEYLSVQVSLLCKMVANTKIISKLRSVLSFLNQLESGFNTSGSIADKLIGDINEEFSENQRKFLYETFNEIFSRCIGDDCLTIKRDHVFVDNPVSKLPFPIQVCFKEEWNEKTELESRYIRDSSSTGKLHYPLIKLNGGLDCKTFFESTIVTFPGFTSYIQRFWCLETDPEQRVDVWKRDSNLQCLVCTEALQQKHFYLDFGELESLDSNERSTTLGEISTRFEIRLRDSMRNQSYLEIMETTFQLLGYPYSNSLNITKDKFYLKGLVHHNQRIIRERSERWGTSYRLGGWRTDNKLRLKTYLEVLQLAHPLIPYEKLPDTIDPQVKTEINMHVTTNIETDAFFDLNKLFQMDYYQRLKENFDCIERTLVYHFKRISEERAIRWAKRSLQK
jgi:hypothetical protein